MNGETFEWDPGNAMSNLRIHNVSFDKERKIYEES